MNKQQQARLLIDLANQVNSLLKQEGILQDTYGVNNKLSFHLDDLTFAEIATISKHDVEAMYQHGALHGLIKMDNVEFHVCHNLL